MNEIRTLDLFSGIGGFALGLRRAGGFRTVAYCEIEAYCQRVLRARMLDGSLDTAPICTDIRLLDGVLWSGLVDLVCGGFPCQDISLAGTGLGLDGERSGLWFEMLRIIRQIRPRYVFLENVSALLARGLGAVLGGLAELGYDAEWSAFSSCVFGVPHCRERLWLVAYPRQDGAQGLFGEGGIFGEMRQRGQASAEALRHWRSSWTDRAFGTGKASAFFRGEHDGLPNRLDRIGALGNSVVPDIVEWIGRRINDAARVA